MSAEEYKERILARMNEKKEIERQIEQLMSVLTRNGVGMDDKLVDEDDFPRSDINVYEVRLARANLHRLRNDFIIIQDKIGDDLKLYHAAVDPETDVEVQPVPSDRPIATPIAIIDLIQAGSPAEKAGLLNGDKIIEFGFVNEENFTGLKDIESVLRQCEGYMLKVVVDRNGHRKRLNIKPSKWSGSGLLGCVVLSPK